MGVYENMIQNKADKLNWSTVRVSAVASKFGITGASEANLSKAFNRTKELPSAQTALPLDQLLGRFLKMCEVFKPLVRLTPISVLFGRLLDQAFRFIRFSKCLPRMERLFLVRHNKSRTNGLVKK